MKKILLPVALIGINFILTAVEVFLGVSTNPQLKFVELLYAIFLLLSFSLVIYSLRVPKHYLGAFLVILPVLFLKFLFWAKEGATNDLIDIICMALNYILMLVFFELIVLSIHGLWVNIKFMKNVLKYFSLAAIGLVIVLTVFSSINAFRGVDSSTDGGLVVLKVLNNLVLLFTVVFPTLLFLETVKKINKR